MSEAAAKIVRLERRVRRRRRLLSLQDSLALAIIIAGLIAAAFVVNARLRLITMPVWAVIIGAMSLAFGAVLIRWYLTRAGEGDAAFLIDESLNLDDRIATSRLIIERGGPTGAFEEALIEDAAARVGSQRAASIVPFGTRRWYALLPISAIGLAGALMIPAGSLPLDQRLTSERADIESAGEHLERTAAEIEQSVPPGTETATLAKEQVEIGRGFRRAGATRSEALRRLSALEERIRRRHIDLTNTRAEEIVSLADRRLGSTLSTLSTPRPTQSEADDGQPAPSADKPSAASKEGAGEDARATARTGPGNPVEGRAKNRRGKDAATSPGQSSAKSEHPNIDVASADGPKQAEPHKRLQEPSSGKGNRNAKSEERGPAGPDSNIARKAAGDPGASSDQKASDQKLIDPSLGDPKPGEEKAGDRNTVERNAEDQPATEPPAGSPEALKAVPDSLVNQAAKALPKMSEELLKKAAELRANELSPADIEKLRKAAEFLARDLTQIGQSKELQKALQEMARQIRPEQIEQVARELGNQEKLKQELEAAARLLSDNQQAKEMVAGIAGQFARMQDQRRQRDNNQRGDAKSDIRDEQSRARDQALQSNRGNSGGAPERRETADRRLAGEGRESSLRGKLQQRSGGEYLYLQSKAGVGAARAPYSSAYPQYRREAERSVQRSQVPANLRSVVRRYFDAINPDAKK